MLKNYVSETDQFLQAFDKDHPGLSKSQQKEVSKYQKIYQLRDHESETITTNPLWENF